MLPAEIAAERTKRYNATVQSVRKVHSDLMILRIKPDFPRPAHVPGQYCTLGLGNWEPRVPGAQLETLLPTDVSKLVRRAYSISNSMLDERGQPIDLANTNYIEFYIVCVRENVGGKAPALTPRLFMLQEGDRVAVGEKITGHYTLDTVQPDHNVIFLSTGTGEAPHNYMTWDLIRRGHRGKIVNACCVRLKKDLGYLPTHQELMRRYSNYKYIGLTTRESDTLTHKFYIQDLIGTGELERQMGERLDPQKTHVFLCGNPKMIGVPDKDKTTGLRTYPATIGVIELMEKRGFTCDQPAQKIKGNIHFEEYW